MTVAPDEGRRRVREAAVAARADAARVRAEKASVQVRSRKLATLAADTRFGVASVRAAFAALPLPAAMVSGDGVLVAVNPAWTALPVVGAALTVGTRFGPGWTSLTSDPFVGQAVAEVVSSRSPVQVETVVPGRSPRRLLMQVGPMLQPGLTGALVVLVDVTAQYEREQRLLFEATHDPLTGAANRASLQEALLAALERMRRHGEPFALLYLDLDGFKGLNDRYGHAAGDEVLRQVSDRWHRLVRAPDVLARVGGDEFVVVVGHVTGREDAGTLAARLRAALDEPCVVGSARIPVRVSVGVALPTADMTAEDALALADQEMYRHKVPPPRQRRAR